MATTGLVKTGVVEQMPTVDALVSVVIREPMDLAKNMRELQQLAHIISPAAACAMIPPNIFIQRIPVVIDPTFDPKTGRGTDVYFQSSIHKSVNVGTHSAPKWEPIEVSLNANAIGRILGSAGVNVTKSQRVDDASQPHYCAWTTCGKVREFDGSWRDLPPGDVEIDLRDGSDHIGGWTADKWPEVARLAAEEKERVRKANGKHWEVKAEIGGWSADRVAGQRRFLVQMAQTKSGNRLGRKLGLKSSYTIEELTKKPFVIFRASFVHDHSNPRVVEMLTANELGALHLLFPPQQQPALPAAPIEVRPIEGGATEPAAGSASAPEGAREIDEVAEAAAEKPVDLYIVKKLELLEPNYFITAEHVETKNQQVFATDDVGTARDLNGARKSGAQVVIDGEVVEGKPYLNIVEAKPYKPGLPKVEDL